MFLLRLLGLLRPAPTPQRVHVSPDENPYVPPPVKYRTGPRSSY